MSMHIRPPGFTGRTEQERLLQVKSYLYQLAEQLNWIFAQLGVEYVTERGASGGWSWRKWNSGVCEVWGSHVFTAKVEGEDFGSLHRTESFTAQLPFGMKETVISCTADKGFPLALDQAGNTVLLRIVTAEPVAAGKEITLSLHIRGRMT